MKDGRPALAGNLKRLRKARGSSQKGLAADAGVSFRSIQNAEAGLSGMDADSLVAVARVFGITVDALVSVAPEVPSNTVAELTKIIEQQECRIEEMNARLSPLDREILSLISAFDEAQKRAIVAGLRARADAFRSASAPAKTKKPAS